MATGILTIWLAFSTVLLDEKGANMDNMLLSLTHEQQQQAVEQIQQLMQQGISSGEAIAIVAQKLREQHQPDHVEK